jgi:2-polyprenyl-3-methyl-5-hydroxy-6-metoxy-1,4-benzoquinol methylase
MNKYRMKKWLPEELEEIPCDFCGSREVRIEFRRADGMRVSECAVCGLGYLNPRPRADLIQRFYEEDYFTGVAFDTWDSGLKLNLDPSKSGLEEKEKTLPRSVEIVAHKFGGFQNKDVLEIGCATGDLLFKIKNEGGRARGLEISDFASRFARQRGLDVKTGTIDDFASRNPEAFDILIALEVIEHVLSPTEFMKFSAQLLRPNGLLVMSTPNYRCAKRFGKEWFGFNASFEHIYFLSIEILKEISIKRMLELEWWETSTYSGGPIRSGGFLDGKVKNIAEFCFVVKNIGFLNIVRNIHRGLNSYNQLGIGHTIFAVFRKKT